MCNGQWALAYCLLSGFLNCISLSKLSSVFRMNDLKGQATVSLTDSHMQHSQACQKTTPITFINLCTYCSRTVLILLYSEGHLGILL